MKKILIYFVIPVILLTGCRKESSSKEFLDFINDPKIWSTSYSMLITDPDFAIYDDSGNRWLTTKEPLYFVYTDTRPKFRFLENSEEDFLTDIRLTLGYASRGSGKMDSQYREVIAWLKENCGFLDASISIIPDGGAYSDKTNFPCTEAEVSTVPPRPKDDNSSRGLSNSCVSSWKTDLCVINVYYIVFSQNDDFEIEIEFLYDYY